MDKKVKVVFIAGYGRSGSTLLDRVLGYSLGACSTGELRHIWERGCLENQLCGCGQKFSECSFWTDVLDAWKKSFSFGDIQEVLQLKNKVDRMRRTPNLLFPMTRSASYRADHQQYSQILLNLYQAIQHRSGCEIIIDSSKDPSYLYLLVSLAKQGLIDLYVIHLVRDSRAVAYSWQRQKKRPEIYWKDEVMPVYSAKKSAFEWLIFNSIISVIRFFSHSATIFCGMKILFWIPTWNFRKLLIS